MSEPMPGFVRQVLGLPDPPARPRVTRSYSMPAEVHDFLAEYAESHGVTVNAALVEVIRIAQRAAAVMDGALIAWCTQEVLTNPTDLIRAYMDRRLAS